MNISKINLTKPSFGIKIGPKLEDEINLKRLHIQSLPNSKRHIPVEEFNQRVNQIKKLFPEKYGSPTTVEIVERVVPNILDNGLEYFYGGNKEITGYEITNSNGDFKYFFERKYDGKEHYDRYKTLIITLKNLEKEENIEKQKFQKIPDRLKPYYVNPYKIQKEAVFRITKNNNNKPNDNDDRNNPNDDDDDEEKYI